MRQRLLVSGAGRPTLPVMQPPSDDRPPPLKHFKRNLETEAAESMFDWLRDRGHVIEEIWVGQTGSERAARDKSQVRRQWT